MTTGLSTPINELDDAALSQYHAVLTGLDGSRKAPGSRHADGQWAHDIEALLSRANGDEHIRATLVAVLKRTIQCEIDRRTQARILRTGIWLAPFETPRANELH